MKLNESALRVLVIEDEPAIRSALQEILEDAGFRVDVAGDGSELPEIIPLRRPDAVVTDLVLPEMNGFDVARLLRSMPETAAIPIIAVTASWIGSKPEWLRAAGFDAALRKPFHPRLLVDELRRLSSQAGAAELRH